MRSSDPLNSSAVTIGNGGQVHGAHVFGSQPAMVNAAVTEVVTAVAARSPRLSRGRSPGRKIALAIGCGQVSSNGIPRVQREAFPPPVAERPLANLRPWTVRS